jgi:hypothetical protein
MNSSAGCDFASPGSYALCDHYLVDDIRVLDLTPPYITDLAIETTNVVRLTMNEPYDLIAIRRTSNFAITSPTGSAISVGTRAGKLEVPLYSPYTVPNSM